MWIYILSWALFLGYVSCGTEYLLDLSAVAPYDIITDVYLGQKLRLQATATFAEGQTTTGVVIELLPSVGSPSAFALREIISYSKGGQLVTTTTLDSTSDLATHTDIERHKGPDYVDDSLKQRYDTRAVVNVGQVESLGAGAAADNEIVIVFDVVYVSIGDYSDGDEYRLSVGEEYADATYIWISQIGVNVKDNAGTEGDSPTYSVDTGGNNNIAVGEARSVELTMEIPRSASTLSVDAVVADNSMDTVYVQEMKLKTMGEAYAFGMVKENIYANAFGTCPLSNSLTLDLGLPINPEPKEQSPDVANYRLVVEAIFQVTDASLVGETYALGWGVNIGSTSYWVANFSMTVTADSWTPFASFSIDTLTAGTISPGFADGVEITLDIPRKTNHVYSFDLGTSALTAAANALSILSIIPLSHGNNIPCDIPSSAIDVQRTESVTSSGIFDGATWTVNISNTGMQPAENISADSDQYTFLAYIMLHPSASEDEEFKLDIDVNGLGSLPATIIAGAPQEYPTDVDYSFTLEDDCTGSHVVGSVMTFKVRVSTERSVTAGNMSIELPIPDNVTGSYLKYHDARVISVGTNALCTSLGDVTVTLFDWDSGSGENDGALLEFPLVCNVELIDDPAEDEFVVEIKVSWKNVPTFMDSDTTGEAEFGIGARIGDTLWLAHHTFNTTAPIDLLATEEITHVNVLLGQGVTSWPGDLKLQWSDDNLNFYDFNYTAGEVSGDYTVYNVRPSLYARYARLVNSDGGMCTDYILSSESVTSRFQFHGSDASKEKMSAKIMFILDDDVTTCMTLPTNQTTDTAKYFLVTLNSTVLGTDGQSSFNILVTGKGLTCNNHKGPQVTMLSQPTDASSALKFKGQRPKCSFVTETPGDPMSCKYECACSNADQCAEVSLLLYYNGSPSGPYEICDVKIVA